jgi:GNAT superfamily N-acetyltransferase
MSSISIRRAQSADLEDICLLGEDLAGMGWLKGRPFILGQVYALGERVLANPNALLLVAEHKGEIIGFFLGEVAGFMFNHQKLAQEHLLYVVPSYRAAGIAKRLLMGWLEWATEKGAAEAYFSPSLDSDKPERWDAMASSLGMVKTGCNYRKALDYAAH